ncbi:hypothetical protein B7494_g6499 [Chlorociboria aeruginascens]|nr:hypothetical protein B7494_g6499 [Chlorociboria aeruginascens]
METQAKHENDSQGRTVKQKPASTASPAPVSSLPLEPPSKTESPSQMKSPTTMKRHQCEDVTGDKTVERSVVESSQTIKRSKSCNTPVKVLPLKYEMCSVDDMVVLIANMISELIQRNDDLPLRSGVLTRFHSRTPPGISVQDYLQRLARHATLTPPLLLSMVYYIDRLCLLYPAFTVTTLTVHRFLITAATVAAKGLSDSFWNNTTYARVGGLKVAELGLLELEFLYRVDWRIVPNPEVLVEYYHGLIERSETYRLESDGESSGEEKINHEGNDPEIKPGASTDRKWKAWMEDVSNQSAASGEAQERKKI